MDPLDQLFTRGDGIDNFLSFDQRVKSNDANDALWLNRRGHRKPVPPPEEPEPEDPCEIVIHFDGADDGYGPLTWIDPPTAMFIFGSIIGRTIRTGVPDDVKYSSMLTLVDPVRTKFLIDYHDGNVPMISRGGNSSLTFTLRDIQLCHASRTKYRFEGFDTSLVPIPAATLEVWLEPNAAVTLSFDVGVWTGLRRVTYTAIERPVVHSITDYFQDKDISSGHPPWLPTDVDHMHDPVFIRHNLTIYGRTYCPTGAGFVRYNDMEPGYSMFLYAMTWLHRDNPDRSTHDYLLTSFYPAADYGNKDVFIGTVTSGWASANNPLTGVPFLTEGQMHNFLFWRNDCLHAADQGLPMLEDLFDTGYSYSDLVALGLGFPPTFEETNSTSSIPPISGKRWDTGTELNLPSPTEILYFWDFVVKQADFGNDINNFYDHVWNWWFRKPPGTVWTGIQFTPGDQAIFLNWRDNTRNPLNPSYDDLPLISTNFSVCTDN